MKTLMLMSLMLTSSMIYAHHPIMLMILIISQTLIICLLVWTIMPTAWFSFILFLIFIGGLMVLFIYITSLAANESFNLNMKLTTTQTWIMTILVISTMALTFFSNLNYFLSPSLNKQISLIFSNSLTLHTLIVMTYLLITLIVVVKISTKIEGPLRNMTKLN